MSFISKATAAAIALSLALGGASAAFAKDHDQGVADGDFAPGDSAGGVSPAGGFDVKSTNNDGQRGGIASGKRGDNAVSAEGDQSDNAPGRN